jgi:hypothetical protein
MATEPDPIMIGIGEGIAKSQAGDRARARSIFNAVWEQIGDDGDPLHRCALAHSMADVQDDPRQELVAPWADPVAPHSDALVLSDKQLLGSTAVTVTKSTGLACIARA